jgi:hypothetical protein
MHVNAYGKSQNRDNNQSSEALQSLAAAHLCLCWWASCLIVGLMQPADELGQQLVEGDAR